MLGLRLVTMLGLIFFDLCEGFAWVGLAKLGCFRFFDQFNGTWTRIQWAEILDETFFGN